MNCNSLKQWKRVWKVGRYTCDDHDTRYLVLESRTLGYAVLRVDGAWFLYRYGMDGLTQSSLQANRGTLREVLALFVERRLEGER